MPKQRNKYLGPAEIPKSVEEFLSKTGGVPMQLLLNYIEELEQQNKLLQIQNEGLRDLTASLGERMDALETIIERLKGLRVLKPLTDEERTAKEAEKAERQKQRPWQMPRGAVKGTKSKGLYRDVRKP